MKYGQELPQDVEKQLDEYIERIKKIQFFKPKLDLKKADTETQINFAVSAFGCTASIEYRKLQTVEDWDAARGAAWDAAWGAARGAAWDAARGAAWDAALDAARGAAWDAAWDAAWGAARGAARGAAWDAAWDAAWGAARGAALDAAWGAADILALNIEDYKTKYPNGNFVNLIPLWEAGLYPVGIIDGKFVVYVPQVDGEFPEELISNN